MGRRVYLDGDFLGDSFLGEKLKELFFFAGAVATPPRATSQAWAAAWPLAWATCVGVSGRFAAAAKPLFSAGDKRGRRAPPRLTDDE